MPAMSLRKHTCCDHAGVYHEQFQRQKGLIHGALLQLFIDALPREPRPARPATQDSSSVVAQDDTMDQDQVAHNDMEIGGHSSRLATVAQRVATLLLSHTIKARELDLLAMSAQSSPDPATVAEDEDPQYDVLLPCWKALLLEAGNLPQVGCAGMPTCVPVNTSFIVMDFTLYFLFDFVKGVWVLNSTTDLEFKESVKP